MKKIFILDPGHGGIIDGIYMTQGKRSPKWSDMPQLFEGEFNRDVVKRIIEYAALFNVECINIVDSQEDIAISERVSRANDFVNKIADISYDDLVYVSIHSNAGGGRGIEVFTSPGQTKSDPIATIFLNKLQLAFPNAKMRLDYRDGDADKEARYGVLTDTIMPAILTENFFMDNKEECRKYLLTDFGRDRIALAHIAAMVEVNQNL